MVARYRLGPLPREEALRFLRERFTVGGIKADFQALEGMYELTGGIPFYLQKLGLIVFRVMLLQGKTRIETEEVVRAFGEMLEELDGEFEVRWLSEFSPLQRRILRALAQLGQAGVTEVAQRIGTKPSDISSSLTRLREALVIERNDEGYRIVDMAFARWVAEL